MVTTPTPLKTEPALTPSGQQTTNGYLRTITGFLSFFSAYANGLDNGFYLRHFHPLDFPSRHGSG